MQRLLSAILATIVLWAVLSLTACGDEDDGTVDNQRATATDTTPAAVELAFDRPAATTDPFNDPSGPFYHQVVKATSPDGLDFTPVDGVVMEMASVPDIIRMPDGRLVIYAVDGGDRSYSGLMAAVSGDDGETWEQGSLQVEYYGEHGKGVDPDAVVLEDGTVRLYYIVFPTDKPPLDAMGNPVMEGAEPVRVMSATSSDGINFVEEEGSRLESDEFVTDPDVVQIGSQWYMYLSQGPANLAFQSFDGMSFTPLGAVRSDGSISNTVPVGDNQYRQFFCRQGIASALSTDGIIWIDDPGVRIAEPPGSVACDPAPIALESGWVMFYKVGPMPQGQPGGPGQPPGGEPPLPPPPA